MMDDCVSPKLIPAALGDVGASGVCFLLYAPAEKISSGKRCTVRAHDSYEHVSILVVDDVSHSILTERVADLTIEAPVFLGYESPCADEWIACHRLSLQVQRLQFLQCPTILVRRSTE